MTETIEHRCHWAGSDQPRMLRTHQHDCEAAGCGGCVACPERHCRRCTREHVTVDGRGQDQTCGECLAETRDNLAHCWITPDLLAEALASGMDSEAAMLVGPAGDPETWQRRHRLHVNAALEVDEHHPAYRALVAWMADCRDERHPLWVLGSWEQMARDHLDQPASDHRPGCKDERCEGCNPVTGRASRAYLDGHLTRLAHDPEFPFEDLARDLAGCREHLETAARNSRRPETGAPCIACGRADLVKDYGKRQAGECDCGPRPVLQHATHGHCTCISGTRIEPPTREGGTPTVVLTWERDASDGHTHSRPDLDCIACRAEQEWEARHHAHGADDEHRWTCPRCGQWWTERDYESKVEGTYVQHADRLPASQIAATYRVAEGTVRVWATRGKVRKYGRDQQGRQLYDVSDVLATRDAEVTVS